MSAAPPFRAHQRTIAHLVAAIAAGEARGMTEILAAVTPGGGKSLLPVIAAARLIGSGVVERVCWVVPRDSLRLQAEEAFADPFWRGCLGHALSVRAADNEPDPSRGCAGYVTTYQAIAAAPDLHLAEIRRRRTLLVVDEVHHLPALSDGSASPPAPEDSEAPAWSRALLPLLESARLRLLLSGTLERADGRPILWLPYRAGSSARTREVNLDAPGWAVVGYSRAQAVTERAVLPVTFGALDGEASWLQGGRTSVEGPRLGPHRLSGPYPSDTTRPALFTALRTGFARELLAEAFRATRNLRARRRRERGIPPDAAERGLGKLLVVAPDQSSARRYLQMIRGWMPEAQGERDVRIATSSERDAPEALAAFRLNAEPSVLVTVAMAYEGLDAPEIAVVAALTHIRSQPWLEQMTARATRVDPNAGPYEGQSALVFHPDDPLFASFRQTIEAEQGATARAAKGRRETDGTPEWLLPHLAAHRDEGEGRGITPLESNALGLRYATLRLPPAFAANRAERRETDGDATDPPSAVERRLRSRIGEMVAAQAVEDEAELRLPRGHNLSHRYNAVLKRVTGNKGRAAMSTAELEAALAWLERNRLSDHLHLLEGDHRYAWAASRRRSSWMPSQPCAGSGRDRRRDRAAAEKVGL